MGGNARSHGCCYASSPSRETPCKHLLGGEPETGTLLSMNTLQDNQPKAHELAHATDGTSAAEVTHPAVTPFTSGKTLAKFRRGSRATDSITCPTLVYSSRKRDQCVAEEVVIRLEMCFVGSNAKHSHATNSHVLIRDGRKKGHAQSQRIRTKQSNHTQSAVLECGILTLVRVSEKVGERMRTKKETCTYVVVFLF